jgi:phenylalanyl-tRNA synthetase beta subunit
MAENQERFREQHLFELANVYYLRDGKNTDLPVERPECVTTILNQKGAFAEAKGFVEGLCELLGIKNLSWKPLTQDVFYH